MAACMTPQTPQPCPAWGWATYVGAFMAQYVVSSVIQGLLGRQPDMMGSWGTYCSLNLMYLPEGAAGGDQGHQPQPPWAHDGDMVGMCPSSAEPQLHSLLRAVVQWCQHQLRGCGAPATPTGTQQLLPLTPQGRWRTSPWSWPWPSCSTRSGARRRGDVGVPSSSRPPGAAPTPGPTHLSLVVIHVLGLQETHGAG